MNKHTDAWQILHVPDKPPIPPGQQPTGCFSNLTTAPNPPPKHPTHALPPPRFYAFYIHFMQFSDSLLPQTFITSSFLFFFIFWFSYVCTVNVLASVIEPKIANTLVRLASIFFWKEIKRKTLHIMFLVVWLLYFFLRRSLN